MEWKLFLKGSEELIQKTCEVYVRDALAGILAQTDEGYEFSYAQEYLLDLNAQPVSLTLPKTGEVYFSTTLFPFFDGLIPESWLLNVICHKKNLETGSI